MRNLLLSLALLVAACSGPQPLKFGTGPRPATVPSVVTVPHQFRVALVQPNTTATFANPFVFTERTWIPGDVSQVRVHIIQKLLNSTSFTGFNNNPVLNAVAIGTPANTTGTAWSGTPTIYSSFQLQFPPVWNSTAWTPVTRDANGFIMIGLAVPAGTYPVEQYHQNGAINLNSTDLAGLTGVVATNGTTGSIPFCIVVEYQTAVPRIVVVGDSIQRAPYINTVATSYQNSLVQLGPSAGIAVSVNSVLGMDTGVMSTDGTAYLDWEHMAIRDNLVLLALGINDINSGSLPQALAANYHLLMRTIRSFRPAAVMQATITPWQSFTTNQNAYRLWVNQAIRAKSFDVDGVLDADLLVRDPGNVNQLLAANSSTGDATGEHLSPTGLALLAGAMPTKSALAAVSRWQWQLSGSGL